MRESIGTAAGRARFRDHPMTPGRGRASRGRAMMIRQTAMADATKGRTLGMSWKRSSSS
jgi:hypothetical protein